MWIAAFFTIGGLYIIMKAWAQRSDYMSMNFWRRYQIKQWLKRNKYDLNYSNETLTKNCHYQFIGCDSKKSSLLLDYEITANGTKEVYMVLRLADGRILTLPNSTMAASAKNTDDLGKCNYFNFEIIEAYSKWRITYNGPAKILSSDTNDSIQSNVVSDNCVQHVILTFFWNVASDPIVWPNNISVDHLMQAFDEFEGYDLNVYRVLDQTLDVGFDQIGALFGRVIIDNDRNEKETFELNFPGLRKVRLNQSTIENKRNESIEIMAVGADGSVLTLTQNRLNDQPNKTYYGVLRWPNADLLAFDRTYINDFSPTSTILTFDLNDEKRPVQMTTLRMDQKIFDIFNPSNLTLKRTVSYFETNFNDTVTYGFQIRCSRSKDEKPKQTIYSNVADEVSVLNVKEIEWNGTELVVPIGCAQSKREELCGGKGSSLGILSNLSQTNGSESTFLIPGGFVVTAKAFDLQIQRNAPLLTAIKEVEMSARKISSEPLEIACSKLYKSFKKTSIEDEICEEIKKQFDELIKSDPSIRVAIRSSAIGEDAIGTSAAGQNDTFLGVQGIENLLNSVRSCWASLFTHQSVIYRVQNIQDIHTKMAVVVQTMVSADCAGVLFTQHPVSGDPHKLMITANFGLGESVVSGSADPDVFIVRRGLKNNNLEFCERKKGEKNSFVVVSDDGGVAETDAHRNQREQYSVNDQYLLKLCQIGIYLEKVYGNARDIEWAIWNKQIYLLQSRPMTSQNTFSSWEILHEFDTAVMSEDDLATFANVGEVMPLPLTPLTITTGTKFLDQAMIKMVTLQDPPKYGLTLFTLSHFRITMKVYVTMLRFIDHKISITNRGNELIICGHEFINETNHAIARHRNGVVTRLHKSQLIWDAFKAVWTVKKEAKKLQEFIEKQMIGIYDEHNLKQFATMSELYDDIASKFVHLIYAGTVHSHTSKSNSIYQLTLFTILGEGSEELSNDQKSDMALMLRSCNNIESAEVPTALEEINDTIRQSGRENEFIAIDPEDGENWLSKNCIEASEMFKKFIKRHAHRAYFEFDLSSITWGIKPSIVIEMLQRSVKENPSKTRDKASETKSIDEIVAMLKSPKKNGTRIAIKKLLPLCQSCVQMREQSKSNLIACIHELRKAFRFMARNMQQNGLLPDPELIFFLKFHELGEVLKHNRIEAIAHAQRRKRIFADANKYRFDEFQTGVPKPLNLTIVRNNTSVVVNGTAVCEGVVTGRACVVHSFAEVSKIQSGDILITHSTDIAWSPYFPILSGVVTELGGIISHGAVVAREYGLPCIVGATNATAIFQDGDLVMMDAMNGTIQKIDAEM